MDSSAKTAAIVAEARRRFDGDLHTKEYHAVHADDVHLQKLMGCVDARPGRRYLDLGTGNGYLALEMARRFPGVRVVGVDVATNAIGLSESIRRERGFSNLGFVPYGGVYLPFADVSFWGVMSRYALHHFPDPRASVEELRRVTEDRGHVVVSDAISHDEDRAGFIDRLQRLKGDGHVHFFRRQELDDLFGRCGFTKEGCFSTRLTYSRDLNDAYRELLDKTPAATQRLYGISVGRDEVAITVDVANVLFRKSA